MRYILYRMLSLRTCSAMEDGMCNNARKHAVNDESRFSFLSGFRASLDALAKVFDHRYVPPSINYGGVADDWKAVGGYLRTAMRNYDNEAGRR